MINNACPLSFGRLLTEITEPVLTYIGPALSEMQYVLIAEVKPNNRELEVGMPTLLHTQNIDVPISSGLKLRGLNQKVF
jgi:hypothetical protein